MNVTVSRAQERLAELTDLVQDGHERVILLQHGKPVAALISADDLVLLEQLEHAADLRAVTEALADPENVTPPIRWEELKAELDENP